MLLGMHNMVVCATLDLTYVVLVPVDKHLYKLNTTGVNVCTLCTYTMMLTD